MLARLSLKFKLTTLVVILVAIGTMVFARFAFTGLVAMLEKAAGAGVRTSAETLMEDIDPDWLASLDTANIAEDQGYQELQRRFRRLVTSDYIVRVELIRLIERREVEHILSVPLDNTKDYAAPGVREPLVGGSLYAQESAGYHVWEMDRPGTYVAGWVPVIYRGQQIGLLTVFIDGSDIQGILTTINIAVLVVMLLLTFLSGALTYRVAAGFEKMAVTDGLMGIYNRKYFNQRLEQEVNRAKRYRQEVSLVMMDIDFFKRVNDTYGHATGDITLKSLAKWVSESIRSTDVVCRYGGEEVAVILTHTPIAGAQEFAERLRLKISQQYVKDPGEGLEFRITVSMGVASFEKGVDPLALIKRADAALYHSKHNGRNRVTIYTDDLQPEPEKDKAKTAAASSEER